MDSEVSFAKLTMLGKYPCRAFVMPKQYLDFTCCSAKKVSISSVIRKRKNFDPCACVLILAARLFSLCALVLALGLVPMVKTRFDL